MFSRWLQIAEGSALSWCLAFTAFKSVILYNFGVLAGLQLLSLLFSG